MNLSLATKKLQVGPVKYGALQFFFFRSTPKRVVLHDDHHHSCEGEEWHKEHFIYEHFI